MRRASVMMQHLVRPPVVTHEDAAWAMAEQGRTVSQIRHDAGTDPALGTQSPLATIALRQTRERRYYREYFRLRVCEPVAKYLSSS